ncbi:MAG: cytochrome c-type biogenesis protein CcmH [Betaproteobacteria bacterium]|nr:cytochrome c-type biogenesis protein CcmH [Betaproteobacteria bacterium]
MTIENPIGTRQFLLALAWLLLCGLAYAKEAPPLAADEAVEKRLVSISEEMRCLVCQNESLASSQADLAHDLRREIRGLIKEGKSDQEVMDFMVNRYGDFVRYRPPMKASTYLLWFGPFVLLAGAIAALIVYLRQRRGRVAEAAGSTLSADERRQAEALLTQHESENTQ